MLDTIYQLEKLYVELYMAGDFDYAQLYKCRMDALKQKYKESKLDKVEEK